MNEESNLLDISAGNMPVKGFSDEYIHRIEQAGRKKNPWVAKVMDFRDSRMKFALSVASGSNLESDISEVTVAFVPHFPAR